MTKKTTIDLNNTPITLMSIGLFLGTGAVIAGFAGLSLLLSAPIFDWIWFINPAVEAGFRSDASKFGLLFLGLSLILGLASYYWLQRQEWARKLTILIVGANIVSNLVRFIDTRSPEPLIIGVLGVAFFVFLSSPRVRRYFDA